jgi:DNA modification methylase
MKKKATYASRIIGFEEVDPNTLTANPLNARMHPESQRAALRATLDGIGWVTGVIANKRTGRLVDGHARVEEAIANGEKTVPVQWVDLDDREEAEILATLDPIGAMATYDAGVLSKLMETAQIENEALADMLRDVADRVPKPVVETPPDADDVPEVRADAFVKPGEVWLLRCEDGRVHRVMCGDSTKDIPTLIGGAKVHLVAADPPYGMNLDCDYTKLPDAARGKKYEQVLGDDKPFDIRSVDIDASEQVWWGADYYRETLPPGGSWYVWDKRQEDGSQDAVIGNQFELAWSLRKHKRVIFRHPWTAYDKKRSGEAALHPTQKPLAMVVELITLLSRPGDIVLDPFLGSGTTLIAAHIEGRVGYGMELSPQYCDVILRRWQQLANVMPERESDGEIHDFTA